MSITEWLRTGGWLAAANVVVESTSEHEVEPDARLGTEAGRYRLLTRLAEGGMSTVYRAERIDDEFAQVVAVKLMQLPAGLLDGETLRLEQVFAQEKQSLASLNHPHIATLIDAGRLADGCPFLVMEYVDGEPLDQYLQRQQPDRTARLRLLQQILDAVGHAHSHFVAHGDLKPSNILVRADGYVVLVDFGISQLLHESGLPPAGLGFLTPAYASPEQLAGAPPTVSSDIYQLGLLVQLLHGDSAPSNSLLRLPVPMNELPLRRAVFKSLLARDKALADDQWLALRAIGQRAAADSSEQRYPTVHTLKEELDRLVHKQLPQVLTNQRGLQTLWFIRRQRLPLLFGLGLGFTLVLHLTQLNAKNIELQAALNESKSMYGFFINLFDSANPVDFGGRKPSIEDVIDSGAKKLTEEDAMSNVAKESLADAILRAQFNYSRYNEAVDFLRMLGGADGGKFSHSLRIEYGYALMKAGNLPMAETVLSTVLHELNRTPGLDGDFIKAAAFLSSVKARGGDIKEAIKLAKLALQVGSNRDLKDRKLQPAFNAIGNTLSTTGEFADAEKAYLKAIALTDKSSRRSRLGAASTKMNLAAVYSDLGRHDEAVSIAMGNLTFLENEIPFARERVLAARNVTGITLYMAGKKSDAISMWESIIPEMEQGSVENRELEFQVLGNLGEVLALAGDCIRATKMLDKSIEIEAQFFGSKSVNSVQKKRAMISGCKPAMSNNP